MQTVLVTGGAGFIGSHTCKRLAEQGYLPVTYDNLSTGHRNAVKWGPFEEGDIADSDRLRSVFTNWKPDAIIHFAASAYIGESTENPEKYYKNNVSGSLTLLSTARLAGIAKVIFSSSCATYGLRQQPLIDEHHPQAPINPYGMTKLIVERILRDFYAAYRMNSIALRYFNAAGADPDGELRERHDPETHLIPLVIGAGLGARPPVTVFGNDYSTPDGTCIRDYIHVTDLAAAHVLALIHLEKAVGALAYNLGTGQGASVQDIIKHVENVIGRPVPYRVAARRIGDPDVLIAEARLAEEELGWKPKHSSIDRIIRTAINSLA